MITYLKKIAISLCLMLLGALIFLGILLKNQTTTKSGSEFSNNIFWIHAADGSTGFKIIQKKHPLYNVTIFYDRLDNIQYQGTMKYIGERREPVCVFEAKYFDGTRLYLLPGGYLEKVSPKEEQ
ncbi:hypothetical protein [Halodesulfovibrio aestuarii]|uniref:DUF3192 domain-containing protein n=1 Tax=Halodesulfovibrio aestuarii TaxID=126333 RepID=A0ABV4JVP2_9BACT